MLGKSFPPSELSSGPTLGIETKRERMICTAREVPSLPITGEMCKASHYLRRCRRELHSVRARRECVSFSVTFFSPSLNLSNQILWPCYLILYIWGRGEAFWMVSVENHKGSSY